MAAGCAQAVRVMPYVYWLEVLMRQLVGVVVYLVVALVVWPLLMLGAWLVLH